MKIKAVICLIILIQATYLYGQKKNDFNAFESKVNQAIENNEIPSIVVAIAKDGKIIYEKAFGFSDIENKIKATTSTSYQLASVSKSLTATGIMVLNHKNIVDIDSSAEKYMLPLKFNASEGNAEDVKLTNLLNHTSGLGTYAEVDYADDEYTVNSFEMGFKKYGNIFYPPGEIFEYSNMGYGLLSYIISKQSGNTFSKFMEQEVFKPLGMKNSFVDKTNNSDILIAKKYDSNLKQYPEMLNNTTGAGNIYSSIHDLILFGMFNLNNGKKNILSKEEIDLMHNYVNENTYYPLGNYGLGWFSNPNDNGYKAVWHEGGMAGVSSMIKLIPEKNIAIAVIMNNFNQPLCQEITNELYKIILPEYNPGPIGEVANNKSYTSDSTYFGDWKGIIKVDSLDIPCTLKIQSDGNIIIDYLDYTLKSYLTGNTPLPRKTFLYFGSINNNSFLGLFPGDLPSDDIRHEFGQLMSLKLLKHGNILSGAIVAFPATDKMIYGYPFYIRLEKQ